MKLKKQDMPKIMRVKYNGLCCICDIHATESEVYLIYSVNKKIGYAFVRTVYLLLKSYLNKK